MALSNETVKQSYQGDGSNVDFAIPFTYFNESEVLVFRRDETDPQNPTLTLLNPGAEQDYTLTGATPPTTPLSTTVTFNDAPLATHKIFVVRYLDLQQIVEYIGQGRFPAESHEEALDRIVAMVQQLQEQIDRALVMRMDESIPQAPFNIPLPKADTFFAWNDTGDEVVYYTVTQLAAMLADATGGGLPEGGVEYDVVEHSGVEGEGRWAGPMVYQGYSERFSELVNLSGIKAVTDYIMDMGYAPPTVSLSTTPNYATLRERGDTISSVDLLASINKVLDDIAEVRFYRGATLIDTQTSGGAIPSGGTNSFTDTDAFSTNRTYSVQVDDTSAQSKPSATSTRTFSFVYPYYYGVGAAGLGASVSGLTKQIINETTNTTRSFTVDGTEKMYFAYPASYGTLSSILDINSFNTVGDWTLTVADITGLDGNPVSYNIYEFNNYAVAGTYQYTFIQ